jgi:D-3-phosphoglycerate dehydrogenase / 2-oxoglutarate reductase
MPENIIDITSDIDSTAITFESLDALIALALENHPDHDDLCAQVDAITEQGMRGNLPFDESLALRINVLTDAGGNRSHVDQIAERVKESITPSFRDNAPWIRDRLREGKFRFFSGGYYDYLAPAFREIFGARPDQILANHFIYDSGGRIVGYERNHPLAQNNGKAVLMRLLREAEVITGHAVILGDGNNDKQGRAEGAAHEFWHFVENIPTKYKDRNLEADAIIHNFNEVVERYSHYGAVMLQQTA